jgi:hypothetical protein
MEYLFAGEDGGGTSLANLRFTATSANCGDPAHMSVMLLMLDANGMVNPAESWLLWESTEFSEWTSQSIPLTSFGGDNYLLRFQVESVDGQITTGYFSDVQFEYPDQSGPVGAALSSVAVAAVIAMIVLAAAVVWGVMFIAALFKS